MRPIARRPRSPVPLLLVVPSLLAPLVAGAQGGTPPVGAPAAKPALAERLPALMPREREISLALAAAPVPLRDGATVYVLERGGYRRVREGANGFTCLVERSHPRSLEPVCYDAEGSATLVRRALLEAELRERGRTDDEIRAAVADGYRTGALRAPGRPGIAYMLSAEQTVLDPTTGALIPYVPHVMFYAPYLTNRDIGAADPARGGGGQLPFIIAEGEPGAMIIVPVGHR